MHEVDPKSRVATVLDCFARDCNLTMLPLSGDGVGSIQRGCLRNLDGLDCEEFEALGCSIPAVARHRGARLA